MTHDPRSTSNPSVGSPPTWREVWIATLTRPSVTTFSNWLAREPNATARKGYTWVFLSTVVAGGLFLLYTLAFADWGHLASNLGPLAGLLLCWGLALPLILVLGVAFNASLTHLIARVLGGQGTYHQLAYCFSAYSAPLAFIGLIAIGLISWYDLPDLWLLVFLAIIYTIVMILSVLAVRAVYQFGWGKAVISVAPVMTVYLAIYLGQLLVGQTFNLNR